MDYKLKQFEDSEDSGSESDSSIDLDACPQNVSMAASATYIPGVSLSDKLRLAASKGQIDKVRELLGAGATFEPDREGRTAVHYAALNGHAHIVKRLSDDGCDIDAQDNLGYTALHRAAAQGHLEVIKVLLNEACQIDRQDEVHGNSALHEAAWNGYSKTLELLVKHNANVMVVNKAGFSGLHLAAQNGHNQSARVLLYAGCNSSHKNNYGDTALHTAGRYGHAGVTRILISARSKLTEVNKNGDTGLHIAAALKRRKIAKLLVEAGINISIKNKQNETAADVARRKEHAEILLVITSQPKNAKKKKKLGGGKSKKSESRLTVGAVEEEKKEKKGFFFSKKKKNKEKESEVPPPPEVVPCPPAFPSGVSEISSSDFNSHMTPEDLIRGFKHHQTRQREGRPQQRDSGSDARSQARGTSTGSRGRNKEKVVRGVVSKYASKEGTQYYKDLAGNIKQGPIGFAPVCNCGPVLKKIEKQMEADRGNMYDHIDASHRTLTDRIDLVDKRSTHQVFAIDKLTRERLEAESRDRDQYVKHYLEAEQTELDRRMRTRHNHLQFDLQSWVDDRLTTFESKHSGHHAYEPRPHQLKYHRDDMFPHHPVEQEDAPPPGKLYKSKSDETLSVSSSHPSRSRTWRSKSRAAKESSDMKASTYVDRAHRLERKIRAYNAKREAKSQEHRERSEGSRQREASRSHDQGESRERQRPLTFHEGQLGNVIPEGHVVPPQEDMAKYNSYREQSLPRNFREEGRGHWREASPNTWASQRQPPPTAVPRQIPGSTANGNRPTEGVNGNQNTEYGARYRSSSVEVPNRDYQPQARSGSVDPPSRTVSGGARSGSVDPPSRTVSGGARSGSVDPPSRTVSGGARSQTQGLRGYNPPPPTNSQVGKGAYQQQQIPIRNNQQGGQNYVNYQSQNGQGVQSQALNNNYKSPSAGYHMTGSQSVEFERTVSRSDSSFLPHSNTFDSTPSPGGPHQSTPASGSSNGFLHPSPITPAGYHQNTPVSSPLNNSPQDYNSSQGSYPSPQEGYPSPQGSYPSPQGSFPSPQGSFPSPQGSFPSPQGSFPSPQSSTYPSPQGEFSADTFQVTAQIHHSKTDSSSNPDSGYGSRIYRPRGQLSAVKLPGSMVSTPNNHNSSIATNGSVTTDQSSPRTVTSTPSEMDSRLTGPFNPVSDVLNSWYQQKVVEAKSKVVPIQDSRNVYPAQKGAPLQSVNNNLAGRGQHGPSLHPPPQPHRVEIGRATQV